jgi:hypothetical protein
MSQSTRPDGSTAPRIPEQAQRQNVQPTEMTAWVGWIGFAAIMMMMLGSFHIIEGLVALFQDEYFLVGKSGLTVHVDYTTWGWIHIMGGVVVIAAGVGLLSGKTWARTVAVAVAAVSALVNIAFLSAYPVWSTIMIAFDVLVIWAVTVHGSELKE